MKKVGKKGTSSVVLCGDPLQHSVWKFSYQDISDMGYTLKSLSLGTSFISIGSKVALQIFSGPNFDGENAKIKTPKNGYVDLTKIPYPQVGKFSGWNDKPMSFILTMLDKGKFDDADYA